MELGRNFIVICWVVPFPVTISVGSHVGGKSDDAQVVTIIDNTWQGDNRSYLMIMDFVIFGCSRYIMI